MTQGNKYPRFICFLGALTDVICAPSLSDQSGVRGRFVFSPSSESAGKVKVSARLRATGGSGGGGEGEETGVQFNRHFGFRVGFC